MVDRTFSPVTTAMTVLLLALTVALIGVESNIVYWRIGPFSVSAYLTLVTPFILLGYIALLAIRQKKALISVLRDTAPLVFLLFFAASWLVVNFRLEGVQNVLALSVLILGTIAFALGPEKLIRNTVEVIMPMAGTLAGVLFIATQVIDTETRFGIEFFSPRQFAMVAVVTLTTAVSTPRRGWIFAVAPYVIFASVIFSASRTTAAVATLLLLVLIFRTGKTFAARLRQLAIVGTVAAAVLAAAALAVRDVQERLTTGGAGQTVITSDSGRFEAWMKFLSLPTTPLEWIFGLGSGASAEFGQRQILHFPQTLNEYLRFLIDNGALGLVALLVGILWLLSRLPLWGVSATPATLAGGLVVVALALVAVTDGAFYSYFVVLPASVVIGNGLRRVQDVSLDPSPTGATVIDNR